MSKLGLRAERNPEARQVSFFKDFIRLNPSLFDGKLDPTTTERWLRDIKKTFATIGTPAEFQVTFGTYKLIDGAINWWETVKLSQDVTGISWDTFEGLFRSHYANTSHRASMIREYERLKQGDMTVNKYYVQFMELAQYAYAPGTDPTLQIVKFMEALRPAILEKIVTQPFSNLVDLVAAAQKAEAFLNDRSITRDHARNKGNGRKMNKKNQRQWQGQNSQNSGSSNSSGSSGKSRYGPYGCFNCGQQGHQKKACPYLQQKSPLSQGGSQGSQSASVPFQGNQMRPVQSQT